MRLVFLLWVAMGMFLSPAPLFAENPRSDSAGKEPGSMEEETMSSIPIPKIGKKNPKPKFFMRKMRVPHCKRGPERCQECEKRREEVYCLLDLDPPQQGMVQRPVLEIEVGGERRFLEYDLLQTFVTKEAAMEFLRKADYPGLIWEQ